MPGMKRKLDSNDVPSESRDHVEETELKTRSFEGLNLDTRLLQAVRKASFTHPTLVQAEAIPLALDGKDILARAKTGSGKTLAYVLPILHKVLHTKAANQALKATTALVLVPTRELAEQTQKTFSNFSAYCSKDARVVNLTQRISNAVLRSLLADNPDIIISTPARASQNLGAGTLSLERLSQLVIDEADLVLSYGYEDDMKSIAAAVPRGVQTFLMSATLTPEVDTLKGLFCRNPAILKLEESKDEGPGLQQYVVRCTEDEKFLLTYVIFKLRLIKGKCIVFVGELDRSYRLKLFLEQFGIKSCVLNSELPVNSRTHVVEEFSKGVYDVLIAADEQEIIGGIHGNGTQKEDSSNHEIKETIPAGDSDVQTTKKRKVQRKEKDYGVSRGIDFQNVACVLNFDLPPTSKSYTHRIGRTARAGKAGTALSFVIPRDRYGKHKPTSFPAAKNDEAVMEKIIRHQEKKGKAVKTYHFDMEQVNAFRYRMNDALRAVTKVAVREARTRELKQELLKSEKLKRHFEENPDELKHLRHDDELRGARLQSHLKHVPDYLMPTKGRKPLSQENIGFVGLRKEGENRIRKARMRNKVKGKASSGRGKANDPLKTFNSKSRRR
ncbi:MAG: hypothetical protein Q9227_004283 [Pyrenula ochraceoflavens]